MDIRKKRTALLVAALLLSVALILLAFMIRDTRASMLYGDGANVDLGMTGIGVVLMENGQPLTGDEKTLLGGTKESFEPGYTYEEKVAVANKVDGDAEGIPEYVRVVVRKYWVDADGEKRTDLDPGLIRLSYGSKAYNDKDWLMNPAESTAEQTVYYLRAPLAAEAQSAELFDGIGLDPAVADEYTIKEKAGTDGKVITAVYDYDSENFAVAVEAQSVQAEHGESAVPSAWGAAGITVRDGAIVAE